MKSQIRLAVRSADQARSSRPTKPLSAARRKIAPTASRRQRKWSRPLLSAAGAFVKARGQYRRQDAAPVHHEKREPQKHAKHGRSFVLRENGPRVRRTSCGRSFTSRVCIQAGRPHRLDKQCRELFQHLQGQLARGRGEARHLVPGVLRATSIICNGLSAVHLQRRQRESCGAGRCESTVALV